MKLKLNFLIFLFIIFALSSCSDGGEIEACVGRGVAYFKEVGSYPTLQSAPNAGRAAEEVARERCKRTMSAF